MMFQPGNDDLVSGADMLPPPALGNEVDRFRRSPQKDDFIGGCGVEKLANLIPRFLIRICRTGCQFMCGPVNIGIFVRVEIGQPIDDCLRFLCRCRIVQPDQGMPIDVFL